MSRYKYVTPNWIDKFERHPDKLLDIFILTEIYILNDTANDVRINISFYNMGGYEYEELRMTDYKVSSRNRLVFRLGDLIESAHPNYLNEYNFRDGWMKITSPDKLVVSGRINEGTKGNNGDLNANYYSIPFFETALEDLGTVYQPIDPGNFEPIGNKNPHFPRPFPK